MTWLLQLGWNDLPFAGVVPSAGNIWIVGDFSIVDTLAIHTATGRDF